MRVYDNRSAEIKHIKTDINRHSWLDLDFTQPKLDRY